MKTIERNIVVVTILLMSYIMLVSHSIAAPVYSVVNTPHNLSTGSTVENQVCVFCHTPHNSGKEGPLWNKASKAGVFKMYTSSSTLTSAAKASSLTANSPSLLCLSCHDGKTAMNILHTSTNKAAIDPATVGIGGYPAGSVLVPVLGSNTEYLMDPPQPDVVNGGTTPEMRVGLDDLTNDHPIGFSYMDAYNEELSKNGLNDYVGMDPAVRFFGPKKIIECSSCHNPHIDTASTNGIIPGATYSAFLAVDNKGSALCLTCHNK